MMYCKSPIPLRCKDASLRWRLPLPEEVPRGSTFYIDGSVEFLFVGFFSGSGRFESADLIAQNVDVNHRGSNDMVVNPQLTLTGVLRGTGNLISVNEPPVVDVERLYTGQLIFN